MKNDTLLEVISSMNQKLNELIVTNDYNLLNNEVISYSQELDKVLQDYIQSTIKPRSDRNAMSLIETSVMGTSLPNR